MGDSRSELAAGSTLGWVALLGEDYGQAEALLAAALARTPGGDAELLAVNRGNLGLVSLFLGKDDQAADAFSASLAHSAQMGARRYAAESLLGLAAVAARASLLDAAARLRSVSLAFHEASGAPLNLAEQRVEERFLANVRDRVPVAGDARAPSMSLDDAVAYAATVAATIREPRAQPIRA